jgi:hypothetical protein
MKKLKFPAQSLIPFSRLSFVSRISVQTWKMLSVFLVALIIRFVWLDQIPVALTHDELYYPTEAQALIKSGSDTSGLWSPFSFTSANALYAELPGSVMVPAHYLITNNPLLAARSTNALLGAALILVLAGISYELFNNRNLAFLTAILATFNPWLWQISRQSFDALFTICFYFLGIYLVIKLKSWWKLLSLPIFALGFFQYQGLKLLLLPILLILSWYISLGQAAHLPRINIKHLLISVLMVIFALFLTGWFWQNLNSQSASTRANDIVLFNQTALSDQVDADRAQSLKNEYQKYFSNKGTVLFTKLASQYISTFDLLQLFVRGEVTRNPTSVWSHGLFYLLDAFLLAIGILVLATNRKWRRQSMFLLSLAAIAPIPQTLNNTGVWIFFRSALLFPIMILVISLGWFSIWSKPKFRYFTRFILLSLTVISISSFAYQYFVRYPVYATTDRFFAERVMANYLHRSDLSQKQLVLADEARFIFDGILVYNNLIINADLPLLNTAYQDKQFLINNLTVATSCIDQAYLDAGTLVITDTSVAGCNEEQVEANLNNKPVGGNDKIDIVDAVDGSKNLAIRSPYSGALVFRIFNDHLCQRYSLQTSSLMTRNNLAVESLSDADFCQNFINNE